MYDLIGDIHGYADALKALLHKLGYQLKAGNWSHPKGRKVIFLGDYIDRGPQQWEAIQIPKQMAANNQALAIMGNHEYNAIAFHTPDANNPGEFLRPHSAKNRHQHAAFLEQLTPAQQQGALEWFKSIFICLELPGLRAVHACWHRPSIHALIPYMDANSQIHNEHWPQLATPNTAEFTAAEVLLKGWEVDLPAGQSFVDQDGNRRFKTRSRWWLDNPKSYQDLAIKKGDDESLPNLPVTAHSLPGYDKEKPLFVGHYWLEGVPEPLTEHIACLDYSIASTAPNRKLCAYRWDGEERIDASKFIWIDG